MNRKLCFFLALTLSLTFVLSGCKGNPLPDGMDEDAVVSAGLSMMNELVGGEYDAVYAALREDVRAKTSTDAIREMMETAADGLGTYRKVTDTMATGVTKEGIEPHGIAVIRAKYDKKSIYFRIAFDTELELIGLEIKRK